MIEGKSGSFEITGNPFSGRITWRETYDIDKNVSIISIDSIEAKSSSWYGYSYYPSGTVSIDGVTVGTMSSGSGTHRVSLGAINTYYLIKPTGNSGAFPWVSSEIPHNADGTKNVSISVSIGLYRASGDAGSGNKFTGSATIELTTIPRASAITSAEAVTLGNPCNVLWTPLSTSFSYKLGFSLGDWSYETDMIRPNTTAPYSYTGLVIPMEVANQITNSPNGAMTVTLYTYSNEAQIGEASTTTFTVTVPDNEDTKPAVSMDLSLVTNLAYPFDDLYIQNLTKVAADISAEGKYGAGINAYQMVIGGGVYGDPYVSGYLTRTGEVTVTVQATDSRGYVGKVDKTISVIPYAKPAIVPADGETGIVCARCDANGTLTDSGTYLKVKANRSYSKVISNGEQRNFCAFRYRCNGGGWVPIPSYGDVLDTILSEVVTSTTTSYTIEVGVIDDLGYEATELIIVPSDQVEFHLREGGDGAAFGEYAEDSKVLSVAESWELKVKGRLTVKGKDVGGVDKDALLEMIYPVGSIYMSVNEVSPATFLGGTWERIKDKFLLSSGDTYGAGSTGGEATHKLTAEESGIPAHKHDASYSGADFYIRHGHNSGTDSVAEGTNTSIEKGVGATWATGFSTSNYSHKLDKVSIAGSVSVNESTSADAGKAHNNMPPYLAVYVWQRIS
jgi:hypothetical protein